MTSDGSISADKRTKVAGLLKLKISNMIDLINQQLEIVEEIEKISAAASSIPASIVEEIISLNEQEMVISSKFQTKFNTIM